VAQLARKRAASRGQVALHWANQEQQNKAHKQRTLQERLRHVRALEKRRAQEVGNRTKAARGIPAEQSRRR
jgi:hypothetical protein